ncbi:MAG TPA: hypothetical protein VFZ59_19255 [Verrucomicrobiae bacterium]|nr:hypothetical protein [Verrucomicrobiae bacterium]
MPYRAVSSLALQPDGKVLIAGQAFHSTHCDENGCYDIYISVVLRLNTDGSLDISFNPAVGGSGDDPGLSSSLALQTDGKVLVAGYFRDFNGMNRQGLVRLGTNGVLDTSFNTGWGFASFGGGIWSVNTQPDGKILIGGNFTYYFGTTNLSGLARLNANGSLDTSFTSDFGVRHYGNCGGDVCYNVAFPTAVKVQPDGKVLVGFQSEYYHCDPFDGGCQISYAYGVTRLNANGSSDSSFVFTNVVNNAARLGYVKSIAVQPDGKIMIGSSGFNPVRVARLNANGSWDNSFDPGPGPSGGVNAVALQPDGKILIGGTFTAVTGTVRPRVARLYGDSIVPSLGIARSNAFLIVSWPVTGLNFQLQESTNLALADAWSPVGQPIVTNGLQISVTAPSTAARKFFRLKSQ